MKLIEPQNLLENWQLQEFPQPEVVQIKYPILLCHGFGALISIVKPSPMHDVCMQMRSHGVMAFAPNIVPYATIETRSLEWVKRIQELKERFNFEKLNIIAHSMSGLDMRYALSHTDVHEDVASLTTLATPHHGASLAEFVLNTPDTFREKLAELFNWFGNSIYPKSRSDAVGALEQLTRDYITGTFNVACPDRESVAYFSYSAAVGKGTEHPLNPLYKFQNHYIFDQEGPNDSFVSDASARWGVHIDGVTLSHLEQIKFTLSKERVPIFDRFWYDVLRNLAIHGY